MLDDLEHGLWGVRVWCIHLVRATAMGLLRTGGRWEEKKHVVRVESLITTDVTGSTFASVAFTAKI